MSKVEKEGEGEGKGENKGEGGGAVFWEACVAYTHIEESWLIEETVNNTMNLALEEERLWL